MSMATMGLDPDSNDLLGLRECPDCHVAATPVCWIRRLAQGSWQYAAKHWLAAWCCVWYSAVCVCPTDAPVVTDGTMLQKGRSPGCRQQRSLAAVCIG